MSGYTSSGMTRLGRTSALAFGLIVSVALFLVLAAKPAYASTFTVTKTADTSDGACDADCSLREAIVAANAAAGADTIGFNIAGSGPHKITISSALPTISDPVTIDGYTQGDATPNTLAQGSNAVLKIELNGSGAGSVNALRITAGDSTVRGLIINQFTAGFSIEAAIKLETNGGNTIEGNFIGTNADGTNSLGNYYGVHVDGASNNTIGGTSAAARNILSGNVRNVSITRDASDNVATGNVVQGNLIGTNAAGTAALGGNSYGVLVDRVTGNTIGGTASGTGNVISGNGTGVSITGSQANDNSVQGNLIGTDAAGTADLGNTGSGVSIDNSPGNHIGGTVAGARNIISGNDFRGVSLTGSQAAGNEVQGNYIGTDATGTLDRGNGSAGVHIQRAPNNTVGGTAPGAGNIISGNSTGVHILNVEATGNILQGNYIGTDKTGETALRNDADGVWVEISPNTQIGGTDPGARNVISANGEDGVAIEGGAASTLVQGNRIGTDDDGESDLGNARYGVFVNGASNTSQNNTIGGTATGAGNLLSGNDAAGLSIDGIGARNNTVQGNLIGTDAAGNAPLGNGVAGPGVVDAALIIGNAPNNTVGGTTAAARNVISGNADEGVRLSGLDATGNVLQGNYIGTDANGTSDLGNGRSGVAVFGARQNTIGGTAAGAGNVISGNNFVGVFFDGNAFNPNGPKENRVQGNLIGTAANGTDPLGNSVDGVRFIQGALDNNLGGTAAGAANTIAHNSGDGVALFSSNTTGNAILSNSIFSNGDLGIDLVASGETSAVTDNDPGDGDSGPNRLQNFPVLTSASVFGGTTTVQGTLDSTVNTTFNVQFFSSPSEDPSGNGEGKIYLGQQEVTTDSSGNASFSFATVADLTGQRITATATGPSPNDNTLEFGRDTSEFSNALSVNGAPVANDDAFETDEDITLTVDAPGVLGDDTDPEGASLTAELVDDVDHGNLTLNANGSFSYAPNGDFNGADSFTYKADDGTDTGNAATVTLSVDPVNDRPAATADAKQVAEDGTLTFPAADLAENDSSGPTNESDQSISVTAVGSAQNGTVGLSGGDVTFQPSTNYNGSATFEYTVCDNGSPQECATGTVDVNVSAVNDAPTISNIADVTVDQDTDAGPIDFTIGDVETAAGQLTLAGTSDDQGLVPDSGIFFGGAGENRTIKITPADGQSGTTRITVKVGDGTNESADSFLLTVRDTTAPTVETWAPKGKKVSPRAKPTVTFSEEMDAATLVTDPANPANPDVGDSTTFILKKGAKTLGATVQYVEDAGAGTYTAVLTPDSKLRSGVTYTVTVTTAAEDAAGNSLDQNPGASENQPKVWRFTVR